MRLLLEQRQAANGLGQRQAVDRLKTGMEASRQTGGFTDVFYVLHQLIMDIVCLCWGKCEVRIAG